MCRLLTFLVVFLGLFLFGLCIVFSSFGLVLFGLLLGYVVLGLFLLGILLFVGVCLVGFLVFLPFRLCCAIRCRLGGLEVFQVLLTMFVPSGVGCWDVFVVVVYKVLRTFRLDY